MATVGHSMATMDHSMASNVILVIKIMSCNVFLKGKGEKQHENQRFYTQLLSGRGKWGNS